jgi:hypothetical protein
MKQRILVRVPDESTTIIGASGDTITVTVDGAGQRWADMRPDDARLLLCSGLADSIPWRELNPQLVAAFGSPPKQSPGVAWSHLQQWADQARPVHWSEKGRIANQALAALNRARAR